MTNNSNHIFSNVDLRKLLITLMLENLLASLMGTVDRVSTTVTYLLLLLSLCGVVFLVVASIKNNKFEGYVRATCFLVIMTNLYLWIKPW